MGSDESHFNFHNCEGQSHKTVSTDHKVTGLTQREMTREWQLVEIDFFFFFKDGKGGAGGGETDSRKF